MQNVFISYSRRDYIGDDGKVIPGNFVDKVTTALSDNGIGYWIDREGLDLGTTFPDIIAKGIEECDTFLFLSSKNSNDSDWTLREISMAIDLGKTVLPVKLDPSAYAPSVALYLTPLQYVDVPVLGAEEAVRKIVARIKGDSAGPSVRLFQQAKLPVFTTAVLYSALVFLTGAFACLTYMFLWAKALRSSEIMGGLAGFVCEVGILVSIYYIIRILRLRWCVFVVPAALAFGMFLGGMLLKDLDVIVCAGLLFLGWLAIFIACWYRRDKGKNFFQLMSKDTMVFRALDPENLIFVYLVIKAIVIVVSHYLQLQLF